MNVLRSPSGAAALAGAAVLVALVLLVLTLRARPAHRAVLASRAAWAGFVLVVVVLTVSLDLGTTPGVNLVPFATIELQLTRLDPVDAAWNLLGNLALLVPFAVLSRAAWGWRVPATTAAGVALSVAVEVGQRFSGRSADVDDVIVNGLGAFLGALLAAVVVRLARRPAGPAPDEPPSGDPPVSVPTPRSAGSP